MTSEAERVIDLYQRRAYEWDADRGRSLFEKAWLDQFTALVPYKSSILDVGCGAAEPIARYFIGMGYDITGIDSSPALIGLCEKRFPDHKWVIMDMREMSLKQRFTGIIAWDSFFHLRPIDQRKMFSRFRHHAASKAVLMFTTGPRDAEALGALREEPLYHASLDSAEYTSLLDENGFNVISHVAEDATCGDHTIWLAQLR